MARFIVGKWKREFPPALGGRSPLTGYAACKIRVKASQLIFS